ncbi:transposase [Neosynechococcus sphagnicola sy1]|uniref:Transposase n=1 Tax=Neosynechococcus sphagnicola sy1 TaxID=1497020 RepID=A0A098THQ8_9CYAN|nr:transposase [Neosynechococcus sphagnicola sy1]
MDNKGNQQWVWLALDADTREIVGVYIGARDEAAARKLWDSLPPVYRQCAIAYTDFWAAFAAVLLSKRLRLRRSEALRAVGKETSKTSYIERCNNTLRQRVSQLVRQTLSFSKSVQNHIGAIWYFIHYYNASLLA